MSIGGSDQNPGNRMFQRELEFAVMLACASVSNEVYPGLRMPCSRQMLAWLTLGQPPAQHRPGVLCFPVILALGSWGHESQKAQAILTAYDASLSGQPESMSQANKNKGEVLLSGLAVVAHTFNPSTEEAEAWGSLRVQTTDYLCEF